MTPPKNFETLFQKLSTHVLCSNFTEIVRREVGETMRCFGDKNLAKCSLFSAIFAPVRRTAPKVCMGAYHVTLRLPVKLPPKSIPICRSYSRKVISYNHFNTLSCINGPTTGP